MQYTGVLAGVSLPAIWQPGTGFTGGVEGGFERARVGALAYRNSESISRVYIRKRLFRFSFLNCKRNCFGVGYYHEITNFRFFEVFRIAGCVFGGLAIGTL